MNFAKFSFLHPPHYYRVQLQLTSEWINKFRYTISRCSPGVWNMKLKEIFVSSLLWEFLGCSSRVSEDRRPIGVSVFEDGDWSRKLEVDLILFQFQSSDILRIWHLLAGSLCSEGGLSYLLTLNNVQTVLSQYSSLDVTQDSRYGHRLHLS